MDAVDFKQRAQTSSEGDVRVTAAVLSAAECEAKFGSNLYQRNIQPVWLEIENKSDEPVWFLPLGLDRAYFTPLESAYLNRFAIRRADHGLDTSASHPPGFGRSLSRIAKFPSL